MVFNKIYLASKLERTTYMVRCYLDDELFSEGSAVCFNSDGMLITAAHVITNRFPIREEDIKDPSLKIFARTQHSSFQEYGVLFCGISSQNDLMNAPLILDIAVLIPLQPTYNNEFLNISRSDVLGGLDILASGFPEDAEEPFNFIDLINFEHDLISPHKDTALETIKLSQTSHIVKHGIVSKSYTINMSFAKPQININGNVFYFDTEMHSGASGGPIIDKEGKIVGIVTKRAVITIDMKLKDDDKDRIVSLEIPSGLGLGVSAKTILPVLSLFYPKVKIDR